jgi:hypothetical protein
VVNSCYVVPHEGSRERLQAARATTEYYGRPVFSDLAMVSPAGERWYARAIMFFKAYEEISEWNELRMQQVRGEKVHLSSAAKVVQNNGFDGRGKMRDSRMGLGCGEAVDLGRGHIIDTTCRDDSTKRNTNLRQRTLV